jgi:hypothetical protein
MDDTLRNMIIASMVLVLASMYGGDTLGSWFHWEKNIDYNDGDASTTIFEFYSEGYEMEYEFDAGTETGMTDTDDKADADYDDNDCSGNSDCDEMYDLMNGKIKNLLYIILLAGGVALYFLNDGDREKGALACLAMGGAGLLAVLLFASSFPEAMDDDLDAFEDSYSDFDEDPSIFGDDSKSTDYNEEYDYSWRPGFAFALVGLSGIIGMAAYFELKD